MNKLAQWIYAYKVCRKYNLKLIPSLSKDFGEYDFIKRKIAVDFFSNKFLTILMHEVGHHVHDRRVRYANFLYTQRLKEEFSHHGRDVISVLEAEAFASRFSRKTGHGDKLFLCKAFTTYSSAYLKPNAVLCRYTLYESVLDKVVECIRKIEK